MGRFNRPWAVLRLGWDCRQPPCNCTRKTRWLGSQADLDVWIYDYGDRNLQPPVFRLSVALMRVHEQAPPEQRPTGRDQFCARLGNACTMPRSVGARKQVVSAENERGHSIEPKAMCQLFIIDYCIEACRLRENAEARERSFPALRQGRPVLRGYRRQGLE